MVACLYQTYLIRWPFMFLHKSNHLSPVIREEHSLSKLEVHAADSAKTLANYVALLVPSDVPIIKTYGVVWIHQTVGLILEFHFVYNPCVVNTIWPLGAHTGSYNGPLR